MNIISVIIASYNAEKTLSAALDAIENQDIGKKKFEVIIVDDGSTDGSKRLIEKYIKKNTFNLQYYYQEHVGVGSARNHAIKKSKGDILAFTDADCICDKNWLSVIERSIREEKKQFVGGFTYSNDTIIFPRKMAPVHQRGITANLALDYLAVPNGFTLFNLGFSGMLGDDIDLVLSLKERGILLSYIPEMRVQHPANILTFERFLMRWTGRMNEVGLYKKHGKNALDCFSALYKPRFFGRISIFSIAILLSIFGLVAVWNLFGLGGIIYLLLLIFILFLTYGYKALVIYQPENQEITLIDKVKTFFYFLLTIPLFFIARIRGMLKFHFFLL